MDDVAPSRFCSCHGVYERSCPSLSVARAVSLGMRDELAFQHKKGFFGRLVDRKMQYIISRMERTVHAEFQAITDNVRQMLFKDSLPSPPQPKRKQEDPNANEEMLRLLTERIEKAEQSLRDMKNRLELGELENKVLREQLIKESVNNSNPQSHPGPHHKEIPWGVDDPGMNVYGPGDIHLSNGILNLVTDDDSFKNPPNEFQSENYNIGPGNFVNALQPSQKVWSTVGDNFQYQGNLGLYENKKDSWGFSLGE